VTHPTLMASGVPGWLPIEEAPAGPWLLLFCPLDTAWGTHPLILGRKDQRQWHDEKGYPVHPTHFHALATLPETNGGAPDAL